jgi:hypothetical protein
VLLRRNSARVESAIMETEPVVWSLLSRGLVHCQTVAIEHGGLLSSLFLAGLIGSASHCVGMCGPFVLSQAVARLEGVPADDMREFHRLAGALLVPYHLGRATTYAGLGAIAATLAGSAIAVTGLHALSAALLIIAAVFFLGYSVHGIGVRLRWRSPGGDASGSWSKGFRRLAAPLFQRPVGLRGYALGVALGFLPCGLLYGAVAAAAASGDAVAGALAMLAFTLGTVPALVAIGFAGHVVGNRWRTAAQKVTPALMTVNAAALAYFAWRMLA